ncbi:MAG TPA: threonine synthase [Vicinamibacterales bacterium]|nr:threonine synthase [Vicinamibacterales bacterium]
MSTRARGACGEVPFAAALLEGLAPDGGLYVPESIEAWTPDELARLPRRTLTEIALRTLRPFVRGELDLATLEAVVVEALNFPVPLVEVEPGIHALELFHGPTLAFKDVGARVMARLMAALHDGEEPLTVLAATSGDTGSAVAHAFHRVPYTRVVILYPEGRVSPTQEAQLTMFNGQPTNVRAYAVAGTFDDCHRLTRDVFGNADLRRRMRLTSANSVNIGRLLPQMVYYFHAFAQLPRDHLIVATPSGNFGNLTAGLLAKRSGLPIGHFIAATNVNDVVPAYLESGRFEPRASIRTLANAMDVGHPSNFERMQWLFSGDVSAMRREIVGSRHSDDDIRRTIHDVYDGTGYLMDPHSAVGYLGLKAQGGASGNGGVCGVFLATAHPAKFSEIVEPIIGCAVHKPAPLAEAIAQPRYILRIEASLDAVAQLL